MSTPRHRALRSDAAANRNRLLAAATVAVKRDGEKVPMARVAGEAGVGVGTRVYLPAVHHEPSVTPPPRAAPRAASWEDG